MVTAFNYGDRATLSMAATPMSHELGIDSVTMGYIFSAFAWAYVIGQIQAAGYSISLVLAVYISGACFYGLCSLF